MSEIEKQALQLFRQLTHSQKLAFIKHINSQPTQNQIKLPSDSQKISSETSS